MTTFVDRYAAGLRLAGELSGVAPDALVLGIPRGGVIVGRAVANALALDLDVLVAHKLGAPHNPELAIGGVGPDGAATFDEAIIDMIGGVSVAYVERERADQAREVVRRMASYRGTDAPLVVLDRTCLVVDDGIATGSTMLAGATWLRAAGAARVIIAVPVAPIDAPERFAAVCDGFIALHRPLGFRAVGQFYEDFTEVTDDVVSEMLRGNAGRA